MKKRMRVSPVGEAPPTGGFLAKRAHQAGGLRIRFPPVLSRFYGRERRTQPGGFLQVVCDKTDPTNASRFLRGVRGDLPLETKSNGFVHGSPFEGGLGGIFTVSFISSCWCQGFNFTIQGFHQGVEGFDKFIDAIN